MKIVVKGAYGESNFGDDLLMWTIAQFFKQNQYKNTTITFWGNADKDYCRKLLESFEYTNHLKSSADILVYGGGTQFFSFKNTTSFKTSRWDQIKKVKLLFSDSKVFLGKISNKIKNVNKQKNGFVFKNIYALGIGIGPFLTKDSEKAASDIFKDTFKFITVRDEVSLSYCNSWGLKNLYLGADICYSKYLNTSELLQKKVPKSIGDKINIGIVVRDWIHDNYGNAYYNNLIDYVKNNQDENVIFTFIVFAIDKDPIWLQKINEQKFNKLIWNPDTQNIGEFLDLYDAFDGFITARYHGAVFASLLNKPTICIEVEPKLKIITQQITEFKLWSYPFNINDLRSCINGLFMSQIMFDCSDAVSKLKKNADDMFEIFNKQIVENLIN